MYEHSNKFIVGVDIGGSHIAAALVDLSSFQLIAGSYIRHVIDASSPSKDTILNSWSVALQEVLEHMKGFSIGGIGIAMPGPFDYERGISLISGLDKYEALYGVNIKDELRTRLTSFSKLPIRFENDAACFGLGQSLAQTARQYKKALIITLGTGFGATFIENQKIIKTGMNVPENGYLFNLPFRDGIAEDYISSRWLKKTYNSLSGNGELSVAGIADLARNKNDDSAIDLFTQFGTMLAECLQPVLAAFNPEALIIGGNIGKAADLFVPAFLTHLSTTTQNTFIVEIADNTEMFAILGAAALFRNQETEDENLWRKSSLPLMPIRIESNHADAMQYKINPFHQLDHGKVNNGFESLANWILSKKAVAIDGYIGNDFNRIRHHLQAAFDSLNVNVNWVNSQRYLKSSSAIENLVNPFLGEKESVWGTKTTLRLEDFFDIVHLNSDLSSAKQDTLTIYYGVGASLLDSQAVVIYVDLPKNELQFRMRAGSVTNIGAANVQEPPTMYKRFYFVDWVVLNEYRQRILNRIHVVADAQWRDNLNWILYSDLAAALEKQSKEPIRVRPWFDPGAWGGQWMKQHFPELNKEAINYAWSFELIVPENGIVFESNGYLLEVSFDWLMELQAQAVIGKDEERFGSEFPIRFDFLDTFDGGNLSIQCHPSVQYIRKHFGENFTQDETYYILDCKEDSKVYLGFQENIDRHIFKSTLEQSFKESKPVNIEEYVQVFPSRKHDLFLIPNGTIHSSGKNNMVLEISATPYIFTFKMYDWLRPDLNGKPRPINIEHAFHNLDFTLKGEKVRNELISRPYVLEQNDGCTIEHLPTHATHFYDVHRITLNSSIILETNNQVHVLMVVEGNGVLVTTANGKSQRYNYAETFVIPAAAVSYKIENSTNAPVKLVKAFVK